MKEITSIIDADIHPTPGPGGGDATWAATANAQANPNLALIKRR